MARLSVNINKIALLRNSRGTDFPNLLKWARDCEKFGAEGITVHPRPDERHIRFDDLEPLKGQCTTEFNIEGYPDEHFISQVLKINPSQCTLVPDDPNQLTSDHGWDTLKHKGFLKRTVAALKSQGIRVALFCDPIEQFIEGAMEVGADRIELYTAAYAHNYQENREKAVAPFRKSAKFANSIGLGVNAGHDLNLKNILFFKQNVEHLLEVSIGHALTVESLYLGLEQVISMYLHHLGNE